MRFRLLGSVLVVTLVVGLLGCASAPDAGSAAGESIDGQTQDKGTVAADTGLYDASGLVGTWLSDQGELIAYSNDGTFEVSINGVLGSAGTYEVLVNNGVWSHLWTETHRPGVLVDGEAADTFVDSLVNDPVLSQNLDPFYDALERVPTEGSVSFVDARGDEHVVQIAAVELPEPYTYPAPRYYVIEAGTLTEYETEQDALARTNPLGTATRAQ